MLILASEKTLGDGRDTIPGIALNTKNVDLYAICLFALAGLVSTIGVFLSVRQGEPPVPTGPLIDYAGNILVLVGMAVFVYGLVDQWRIATRRKSPGELPNSKVWFCPYCGNLDARGGERCPGCGKALPRFIATRNGRWTPADSDIPHKVAVGKDGKRV